MGTAFRKKSQGASGRRYVTVPRLWQAWPDSCSQIRLNHADCRAGTLLNLKLTPQLIKDEAGKQKLVALLRSEEVMGGFHVQFNVVDRDTLLDAQEHPEKYSDLLVRVAGYSAFFVDLRKEAQDLIINRTEVSAW